MISRIRNWLGRTLTRKFTLLLAGFLALQALQLGVGVFGILHIGEEEAGLVNEAGRQRYRTLLLGTLARQAVADGAWTAARRGRFIAVEKEYERYFSEFERRAAPALKSLQFQAMSVSKSPQLQAMLAEARGSWEQALRPLLAQIDPARPDEAHAALRRYELLAPEQVARLDSIVNLIDQGVAEDIRALALFQSAILGLSLLLGIVGFVMTRFWVTRPLNHLVSATQAIASGASGRRVSVATQDELGALAGAFNRMAGAIEERASQLSALNQVAITITSSSSLKDALDEIMRSGIQLTGAQAACIAFYDQGAGRFTEWVTQGLPEHFVQNMSFEPGSLADEAFTTATPGACILSNDWPQTKHKLSRLAHDEGIKCFICLPLTSHASRLGVVYFYRTDRDSFTPAEIELLTTFARLAAEAIENRRLHERLAGEAHTDPLTGLYNRREFDARLAEEHQRARRHGKPFALMMIDIDRFKHINDAYGHPAGDAVLKALAEVLKQQFRDVDIIARYGGEEFVVILPEIGSDIAKQVAERVRRAIASTPFPLADGIESGLTASIGVAYCPNCGASPREMIERADQALYSAKEAGRNRVVLSIVKEADVVAAAQK